MAVLTVQFTFHSGIRRHLFTNLRLSGSWNEAGEYSSQWSEVPMTPAVDETGCDAWTAAVTFDSAHSGAEFQWGVAGDIAGEPDTWLIATEVPDAESGERYRSFVLSPDTTQQDYWLVHGRRFGAQRWTRSGDTQPGIQFSLWAPNARSVEVVFGSACGYIGDQGEGIDPEAPVIPLQSKPGGIWEGAAPAFRSWQHRPYMFRVTNEQGGVRYKVDIYSRYQAGCGAINPGGAAYTGSYQDLDGIVSCSIVTDPDLVAADFGDTAPVPQSLMPADDFWADEYTPGRTPPETLTNLIIYELHVGSLGYPSTGPGSFEDAVAFVDNLGELGVNAVELLPVLEFDGDLQWGYGTSLFFCLQTSAGGADQLKHFVRACHQRGIAVIIDVVYNHFAGSDNDRSEWGYDSDPNEAPQDNIWYWYEGQPGDYPGNPDGGYLNNGSSGYTPRFSEEQVRRMFTSSAAALLDDFHIDGLRVDLTDAIHQNNTLNADGSPVPEANLYGVKFLRELARTVKLVNPSAFLIAEDHTGWGAMTQPLEEGGIGFDAVWYADFYHHLIGDGNYGDSYAKLLRNAGCGGTDPLRMDYFAGALLGTQLNKIVYHENHDVAGNEANTERTMVTAVNGAPLSGLTRKYAEARSRFVFGMSALSAGTPMFLMGEEIGASHDFRYNDFYLNKEDLLGQRNGDGRFLYRFYCELIEFVSASPAARSRVLDVIHQHNQNRVIAFTRSAPSQELLVIASLNDASFDHGYVIGTDEWRLPSGGWREVFNSDGEAYGGNNVGNDGATLQVSNGTINAVLPACGFLVFEKS